MRRSSLTQSPLLSVAGKRRFRALFVNIPFVMLFASVQILPFSLVLSQVEWWAGAEGQP